MNLSIDHPEDRSPVVCICAIVLFSRDETGALRECQCRTILSAVRARAASQVQKFRITDLSPL